MSRSVMRCETCGARTPHETCKRVKGRSILDCEVFWHGTEKQASPPEPDPGTEAHRQRVTFMGLFRRLQG